MTTTIIITFCTLLLIAYLFDYTASRTKIPSVILLLGLGWIVRQTTTLLAVRLPDLSFALPVLGTLGLILIVLEGSLELELNVSKLGVIRKSLIGGLIPMLLTSFLLACLFYYFGHYPFKESLINSIPLSIISSAIAIPSVKNLSNRNKEFVIYESSLSDIFGVLFFAFIALNEVFDIFSFLRFGSEILLMSLVSFAATAGLSFLLSTIKHHIKFVPIILLVILIYSISKIYHLPALIFILLFGLFIGNLDELKRFKWIGKLKPDNLNNEVQKFKELAIEAAFVVRALFFILFGYLIKTKELLNVETLMLAVVIVLIIYIFRAIQLRLSNLSLMPLLFIAPRGLITILLFISIDQSQTIPLVNNSLVIQVIIISALIMMVGLMFTKKQANNKP
jgi:potassium/hydrogen antiporter